MHYKYLNLWLIIARIFNPGLLMTNNNGAFVEETVTETFFNEIIQKSSSSCAGVSFYSRSAFVDALKSYPEFGNGDDSVDVSLREIAAFFAHVTYETNYFCNIEEIDGPSKDYCDTDSNEYPCVPGKSYHGRGPLQLTWNNNYGAAGSSIGFNGLEDPDIVAVDSVLSFKTALWFWMTNVHDTRIQLGEGFSSTIRAINAIECNGGNAAAVNARVDLYVDYCNKFNVQPGDDLYC